MTNEIGLLTTSGCGFPTYTREVPVAIEPELLVEMEAKALMASLDPEERCKASAAAVLRIGPRIYMWAEGSPFPVVAA